MLSILQPNISFTRKNSLPVCLGDFNVRLSFSKNDQYGFGFVCDQPNANTMAYSWLRSRVRRRKQNRSSDGGDECAVKNPTVHCGLK
jgi:hypothetical protein